SRTEQAAWKRPAPNDALLVTTAGRERPDFGGAPIHRPTPHVDLLVTFGLRRIGGRRDLFPARRGRAVQLDPEVAVIERRIVTSVARIGQRERDIVAKEVDAGDIPGRSLALDREQAFAGGDQKRVVHSSAS